VTYELKIHLLKSVEKLCPKNTAPNTMKKLCVMLAFVVTFLQGCELSNIEPQYQLQTAKEQFGNQARNAAYTYYVSTTGNDNGDGSAANPWKTLRYAVSKTPANQGYEIELSAGIFVESGLIEVPLGVSIYGAGIDKTFLKAASSFYYHPTSPAYATDKFLISLKASGQVNGNQTLSGFTIDGDSKKLHGGIYVHYRSKVIIDAVKVLNTNFTGIWLWDVKDSKLMNSKIINSSWGSASYCAGALNLGNIEGLEIANLEINEDRGYGIKAIGPNGNNLIKNLKIRDSRVSVHPYGLWNNGQAPNIAIELWSVNLIGSEIYNTYVDNTISLINSNEIPSTGIQSIRVHHNVIDMETRANGKGYGIELTVHDAEIDHNYFIKGTYGIANWDHPMQNWNIHHNTFYALEGTYPGEILRSQKSGLHNVKLHNNTIEFAGTKTMNVIGLYGGVSKNVDVKNNLFINNNTSYSYYPNKFIHLENGATISNLTVQNNSFSGLPIGTVAGTYGNNITSDPLISKTGSRPNAYYYPQAGSPLIDAGRNVGYSFTGSAPDIGAFEFGGIVNQSAPSSARVTLTLEAYTASLTGFMAYGSEGGMEEDSYFYVPSGYGNNYMIPPSSAASFTVDFNEKDNYVIWAKVKSPTPSNQSSYVYNGKGKWFVWDAGVHESWTWVQVSNAGAAILFPFEIGVNEFKIAWLQDNVKVEKLIITNDLSFVP